LQHGSPVLRKYQQQKKQESEMNSFRRGALIAGLLSFNIHALAIEGLRISVQCPDVVLGWPSNPGETYIVQWKQALESTNDWLTLTDFFPAATGTHWTSFVHSNQVQTGGATSQPSMALLDSDFSEPLAKPGDGSGSAVPLALYPPGFDLSLLLVLDPITGQWANGTNYTAPLTSSLPMAESSGAGAGGSQPQTGFYRVVRDDVHFWGLTNGAVLSGLVSFPIEFSVTSTDTIVGLSFYSSGFSLAGASQVGNAMEWDTTAMPNGTYTINAEVNFNRSSDTAFSGTGVTVSVSNVISFPNYFTHVYGNEMWIYAQTIPNAAYMIDIYDEDDNYLGSFGDYADGSGLISFLWDLTDGRGYTFDSTNFTGIFTVDTSSLLHVSQGVGPVPNGGPSSSAVAVENWVKEPNWSWGNSWAVACAPQGGGNLPTYTHNMMLGGPGGEDGGVNFQLVGFGATLSPGNNAYDYVFDINTNSDKTDFLTYLSNPAFRNCYFFGDGDATSFGSGRYNVLITLQDLRNTLGNTVSNLPGVGPLYAMKHPYRLVFIDACSSAKGNLSEGFGIPAFEVNTNYFRNPKLQSRAFVGYKEDISSSLGGNNWINRSLMLGWFFNDWYSGLPITNCVYNAKNDTHSTQTKMNASAVVYGAYDLRINTDTTIR
jgi:hypothetical protein